MEKVITKILTLSSIALLALASCKKNDALVTTDGGTPGALTANTTTLALDKTKLNDATNVITFSSTPPKYTYSEAATVTLQIDSAGDNWKKPTSITLGNKVYTQAFNTAAFNDLLLKLNLAGGKTAQINVRISYALSSTVVKYSNVVTMTVTPFNLASWVYVNGSFNGWPNPPSAGPVDSLLSATGNGVYTGVIYFPAGKNDFLLLPQKSSYDNKWATNDPTGSTSSHVVVGANNNLYAPSAAGYYLVTFDKNALSIKFDAVDFYSVTGNEVVGGDWGVDQLMKFVNDGSNTWTSTLQMAPVSGGGYKIRQDAAWSNSWGTPQSASVAAGKANTLASDKDDNLAVTVTGNYQINIVTPPTLLGSTAPVTIGYSVIKK